MFYKKKIVNIFKYLNFISLKILMIVIKERRILRLIILFVRLLMFKVRFYRILLYIFLLKDKKKK